VPVLVALALGGNVEGLISEDLIRGDTGGRTSPVERTLAWALRQLAASLGPLRAASLYRTRAVSPGFRLPQPDFLNTAALVHTTLPADGVLALAKALELAAGRRPGARVGPRPLDIDLLLYGDRRVDDPEMTLPHPRLRQRRFMLAPLAEIAPDLAVPPDGATVRELLARLGDPGEEDAVERIGWEGA
jgi:2-amino-4-hydroxy-6-hydroxymethyldihydropteridine diphosphokinase